MPESLASLKRKFYKSLDQFTSASQPSTDISPTTSNSHLSARERLQTLTEELKRPPSERATKRLRPSPSNRSLNSSRVTRYASKQDTLPRKIPSRLTSPRRQEEGGEVVGTERVIPAFAPQSQDSFLARLKTFASVSQWHPKPEVLCEVEWAKHGWACVGVNTVQCKRGCEARVRVELEGRGGDGGDEAEDVDEEGDRAQEIRERAREAEEEAEEEDVEVEVLKRQIIEGHGQDCLWRRHSCHDDIYRLRLTQMAVWQKELRERFLALLEFGDTLMEFEIKTTERTHRELYSGQEALTMGQVLAELPNSVVPAATSTEEGEDSTSSSIPQRREKALTIALHGWSATTTSDNALLACPACFQRIGLWMYTSQAESTKTNDPSDPDTPPSVDLQQLHRDYCPYTNPRTQNETGDWKTWSGVEVLHQVVENFARQQQRRRHREAVEERRSLRRSTGPATPRQNNTTDDDEDYEDDDNLTPITRDEDGYTVPRLQTPEQKAASVAKDDELMGRMRRIKRMFSMTRKSKDRGVKGKGSAGSLAGGGGDSRRGSVATGGSGLGSSRAGSERAGS
ncbi:hypothetical protein MBLNU230_g3706t1 [Neophaeotheca triangularis]